MSTVRSGGGWPAIRYTLKKAWQAGGVRGMLSMWRAMRSRNACKTCALGMGGQLGGMVNEAGRFPEVCKKSVQAMAADMQGRINEHFFTDFSIEQMRGMSPREFEAAGRLTTPLYAGPLDSHYRPITWGEAMQRIVKKMRSTTPDGSFFYFSGRSSNEAGFLLQLFARLWGTNNVNNCSYYCHQASGVALSSITGSGTATVALDDLEHCDLLFLIGCNPASNHPRLMRNIVDMRRRGGKVIVINPMRELGLVKFRVPSDVRSLLFGSRTSDLYVQPHIGGDIALLTGIAKRIVETNRHAEEFAREYTDSYDAFVASIADFSWQEIERESGVPIDTIHQIADLYAQSQRTIFAWAMGLTHHEHGVENIQAIGNLALLRGMVGKPGAGLLPLRGHSNVQGIGSMGVAPQLKDAVLERLQTHFNVQLPTSPGMDTMQCMERAAGGNVRFAMCIGGNLYGSNPDAPFAAKAMQSIDQIVYLSTTLNTGHAWGTGRETIILPVLARDEEQQPTTQESMFNYVRLSDGGPIRFDGLRSEVAIIADLANRMLGNVSPIDWSLMQQHGRIREAISRIIPGYDAIGDIDRTKKEFHIAGRTFHTPVFATPSGKAVFHALQLPRLADNNNGQLRLMTVRSEGQFNTVVYEDEDLYRGQTRRDVILMHEDDIARLGLKVDQPVTVRSATGSLSNVKVRPFDIRPGNAVMYYPEANALIGRAVDPQAKTPSFKNVAVTIEGMKA